MIAQVCELEPGDFVHTLGDCHIYLNHMDQVHTQLQRQPFPLPTMHINPDVKSLFDFSYEDFELRGYRSHDLIRAPIAV
jgi:thymidylate synthase